MTKPSRGWLTHDAPCSDEYQSCIKCGLCLESCPTFQETGRELESPRGRVQLIASVARGEVPLERGPLIDTMFSCLDCRACETSCPSGVPIGTLIEKARGEATVAFPDILPRWTRRAQSIIGHPRRLQFMRKLIVLGQRWGIWRRGPKWPGLPDSVGRLAATLRPLPMEMPYWNNQDISKVKQLSKPSAHVQLFVGCIMNTVFSDANQSTYRVLARHGCHISVTAGQVCCGALAVHAGDRREAKRLARINIDRFLLEDADYLVTNAGGCGAALLEYPEWFRDDAQYSVRAQQFAARIKDAMQVISTVGFQQPIGAFPHSVTYQGSCHLHHVMKIGKTPEAMLSCIPGITYQPMPDLTRCCGSAGIYNLTHPIMADTLLVRKMADIPPGTEVVVTGNPGCWLQLEQGVQRYGPSVRVMHLMQVLDEAYQAGDLLHD